MTEPIVTGTLENYAVTIAADGHLTLSNKQNTVTFAPNETEQLLDMLLIWRYGLERAEEAYTD